MSFLPTSSHIHIFLPEHPGPHFPSRLPANDMGQSMLIGRGDGRRRRRGERRDTLCSYHESPHLGHTLSRSRTWNDDLTHPGALVRLFPGRVPSHAPSSGGSFTRYLPSVEDLPSGFAKWVGDRTLGLGECVLRCQGVRRSRTEESDGQKRAWRPAVELALPNNGL